VLGGDSEPGKAVEIQVDSGNSRNYNSTCGIRVLPTPAGSRQACSCGSLCGRSQTAAHCLGSGHERSALRPGLRAEKEEPSLSRLPLSPERAERSG